MRTCNWLLSVDGVIAKKNVMSKISNDEEKKGTNIIAIMNGKVEKHDNESPLAKFSEMFSSWKWISLMGYKLSLTQRHTQANVLAMSSSANLVQSTNTHVDRSLIWMSKLCEVIFIYFDIFFLAAGKRSILLLSSSSLRF